ncbi:MAG: TIGR04551 family protein [Polyangiaceae bacterium]
MGQGEVGTRRSEVYAEDWWSHARPTFELHGYYRLRAELFHNFALGRKDPGASVIWAQPSDTFYSDSKNNRVENLEKLCGAEVDTNEPCDNNTQAGANMRFRLNPELHNSDNARILSQVDLLDNLVLGSTPDGYTNRPGEGGGYQLVARGGYSPLGAFSTTQWAPSAGQTSSQDSIVVKRVWGEYLTPVGLLRFGRMPSHWGLGILANSGDGYDSDWQSTADRIMLVTGIKQYDLYFAGAWDFPNEGPISSAIGERQGQQYDVAQLDDVSQYVLAIARRRDPELQKLELAKGELVVNGGGYFVYRHQFLANDAQSSAAGSADLDALPSDVSDGYVRRDAQAFIPDAWLQINYKKFRFEAEAAWIVGSLDTVDINGGAKADDNPSAPDNPGWNLLSFGLATQTEYKAVEDRLRIHFGFGYATGDQDVEGLSPGQNGLQPQLTLDRTFSTFRFHPDYRIDLILWRNILNRVQGAYYFRPGVDYDFTRDKNGQRLGGGAAVVWSRAAEFVQTPGNARDLGVELDFQLYYQSKDGTLNDDPDKMGGFYASLQYGVLFPLAGLGYLPRQIDEKIGFTGETDTAQTLRLFLGIMF